MSINDQTEQVPIGQAFGGGGTASDLEQVRGEVQAEDIGQERPLSRTKSHSYWSQRKGEQWGIEGRI